LLPKFKLTVQRLECFTARVQIYPTAQRLNRKTANLNIMYKIFRYLHTILLFVRSKILFFRGNPQKYTFSVYLLRLYNAVYSSTYIPYLARYGIVSSSARLQAEVSV
jgi:hypothetical protein